MKNRTDLLVLIDIKFNSLNKNIHNIENLIFLLVKQYIYTINFLNTILLSTEALKKITTKRITAEKYLLLKNCGYMEFERYWQDIYNILCSRV